MFSYHAVKWGEEGREPKSRFEYSYGFPKEWLDLYNQEKYSICDPFIAFAQDYPHAFTWDTWKAANECPDRFTNSRAVLDRLAAKNGLVIPVYDESSHGGLFCLGFGPEGPDLTDIQNQMLRWTCHMTHMKYLTLPQSK